MADDEVDRAGRAGDERPDPAAVAARSMTQLAQQMREMADRMLTGGLAGWPVPGAARPASPPAEPRPGPGPAASGPAAPAGPTPVGDPPPGRAPAARPPGTPGMPPTPTTMSAQQVQAVVDDIAARRSQVQALVAQLTAFDEQLGTLETSLRPVLQWLRTWSDLEGAVTDFWTPRPPRP